jgi:hypothetical protein
MAGKNGNGKTPQKTPRQAGSAVVPMRRTPNGGLLRSGGTNRGGTGRPPSVIREQLRGSVAERVKILEAIADDADAPFADRMKAIDILAKYGLGTTSTETDTEGKDAPRQIIIREAVE